MLWQTRSPSRWQWERVSQAHRPRTDPLVILCLARGQPGVAQPIVEKLLQRQPNNLIALTAQARLQFARRAHEAAFQTYQKLLSLNPDMQPDPRIGLGLCAWVLGDRERARAAWERSLQRVGRKAQSVADLSGSTIMGFIIAARVGIVEYG